MQPGADLYGAERIAIFVCDSTLLSGRYSNFDCKIGMFDADLDFDPSNLSSSLLSLVLLWLCVRVVLIP